ncbi:TPA: tape measure protein [Salmonella enterica]|nr:tape measure protein [Salmonella enterica]
MTQNVGDIEYVIKADTAQLLRADKQVRDVTDGMEVGFKRADKAASSLTSSFGSLSRVATSLMAILSVQQVSQYADAWTTLNNKLANALRPSEQLVDVTERVFNITQQTRGSLDATASLYARLERATREYGTSADDLAKLTTIINQGFVVSGATAQEAENAIIQLSQGLASGALRGEEFNSVNEQGNRLIVALADSMGVGIGQMRQMAAAGKLTTDVVVNGLLSQGVTIGNEFANTTTTISQALQVAGNNITKFFGENSTVKTGTAIFNDAVISVSENIGALSAILTAAAAVMGSRYVGALTMATAAKVKAAVAARNQSAAEMQAAQAVANKAAADLRAAAVAKERALDEIRLAEMMKQTAVSATNAAAAEQRLSAARVAAAGAVDNYNRALEANKAAQAGLSTGAGLVSRGLSLIGGPAGAAMLAASAILYFSQRAKEARDDANNLADSVNELSAKFQTMSHTELAATIGKLSQNLPTLSDAVADAQKEFNDATAAVQRQEREIANWGTNTTRGRQAAEALGGAQDKLAIATLDLERAQNRLSQTQNAINIGRATLNGTMRQGIDLLRRDGEEAGVTAGMMGKLGDMINFAAKAKEKYNSSSLMVMRSEDGDKLLSSLEKQNALLSLTDKRERAVAEARQAALDAGVDAHSNQMRQIEEAAAKRYDLQKADSAATKSTKEGSKAVDEAAQSLTLQQAALDRLNTGYAEGSLELAQYDAVVALGNKATTEQIAKAKQQAKAIWQVTTAIKNRAQAEQAKRFTDQEIATNKTTPDAVTGAVQDPVAQINLQEQQKLAALAQYQQMGVLSVQQYEDAKTAIQEQASNARKKIAQEEADSQIASTISILNAASSGFDSLAGIISNTAGKANSAYVAMFAAAKSFAIAAATLDFNGALLKALNAPDSLTTAQRFANYAAVASAGASVLSNIASVSMSGGRRYGGTVSAGNAYRVNEDGRSEIFQTAGGQQMFIPNQSGKVISADKAGGGGVQNVYFTINTTGGISDAEWAQIEAKAINISKKMALFQISDQANRPNGMIQPRRK